MARMAEQRVAKFFGDGCICSIGTALKAQANDKVHTPLWVNELDTKRLVLSLVRQGPSIMNRLCEAISLRLSNLLVQDGLQEELENIKFCSHPIRKGLDCQYF